MISANYGFRFSFFSIKKVTCLFSCSFCDISLPKETCYSVWQYGKCFSCNYRLRNIKSVSKLIFGWKRIKGTHYCKTVKWLGFSSINDVIWVIWPSLIHTANLIHDASLFHFNCFSILQEKSKFELNQSL